MVEKLALGQAFFKYLFPDNHIDGLPLQRQTADLHIGTLSLEIRPLYMYEQFPRPE
jgi:hypothetical protein